MTTARDELWPLYRQMRLIRRVEEESARAYVQGKIGGFLHLYIGQEAIAVGTEAAIRPTDHVVCLLYTSPSPRDVEESRMPSSA